MVNAVIEVAPTIQGYKLSSILYKNAKEISSSEIMTTTCVNSIYAKVSSLIDEYKSLNYGISLLNSTKSLDIKL